MVSVKKLTKYKDILFSTLAEITSLIIAGNDKKLIFKKLLDCCLLVLEADRVYLLEVDGEKVIRYSKTKGEELSIEIVAETSGIRLWMMKESKDSERFQKGCELGFDVPMLASSCLDGGDRARVIISAPLMAKKSMFGLLVAIHRADGHMYSSEDVRLLTILANQAAIAVENTLLYQKLEREAITDGLTDVYNYRFLITSLEKEIKRARRFDQVFCFVMLDVDNLKSYNDRLGHLRGSQALKEIAMVIRENCREIDLVSKYGGDEFGIVLPQTDLEGACVVTQRIIDAVRRYRFDGAREGLLTCSAGISCFPKDAATVRGLIACADRALYQAKRAGKSKLMTTAGLAVNERRTR